MLFSSYRKFGSEFLCKTRYRNNLPLPPFAPKLLALPSSMDRYIKYQATGLADTSMNDLLLDHQLGMPIDLVEMGNYFNETGASQHQQAANGSGGAAATGGAMAGGVTLDQRDNFLLTTPIVSAASQNGVATAAAAAGGASPSIAAAARSNSPSIPAEAQMMNGHTPGAPRSRLPAVSWLRRTEYISSESPIGSGKGAYRESQSKNKKMQIDQSREGQIKAIEKTFDRFWNSTTKQPLTEAELLSSIKHPVHSHLHAVETIPIFPDFQVWGNSYTLATFDFDPEEDRSRRNQKNNRSKSEAEGADQDGGSSSKRSQRQERSSNALIKPMSSQNDSDTWLAYYLPDLETAREINGRKRVAGLAIEDEDDGLDRSAQTPPREDDEDGQQQGGAGSTLPEGIKVRTFAHQRDCTYQTMPCSTLPQFVFTFRDGERTAGETVKCAFYDPIQSKLRLSKKHKRTHDMDYTVITHIDATFRRVYSTEQAAKSEALEASGLL
ncbi:hypothetical protein BGW42_004472 [Actinomortierella wolfii]|nr:hypothetical protein BGW42_004472 [Actinomortierella wolfii]